MTLADLRRAVALSQQDLAHACGVSKTTVSSWERGTAIPRLRHVRVLADALKTGISEIQHAIEAQKKTSKNTTLARQNASVGTSITTLANPS